jgi:hypothetical protein
MAGHLFMTKILLAAPTIFDLETRNDSVSGRRVMGIRITLGADARRKNIAGVDVEIPRDLLEYYEAMARHADKPFEEYVESILAEYRPSGPWLDYPTEAAILLTLYRWAYAERDCTIRTLCSIWQRS